MRAVTTCVGSVSRGSRYDRSWRPLRGPAHKRSYGKIRELVRVAAASGGVEPDFLERYVQHRRRCVTFIGTSDRLEQGRDSYVAVGTRVEMIRALEKGGQAFASREWRAAFDQLAKADREAALGAADLERLGDAAYLVGKDDEAIAAWTRAHNAFVEQDECLRAARLGFWLSLGLMLGGNAAQSGGWLSRTQRLISDKQGECAEHGLMLVISGLFSMFKGDAAKACSQFEQATSLGKRFADPDLLAVSVLSHGQALIQMQRTDEEIGRAHV